ncbi:hypothetical protein [Flagellimonas sp.]|uniref:hypothetical protein n=1 Tax=Flagellimonas sp. TaxID=2058762 RepID=UPI003BABCF45
MKFTNIIGLLILCFSLFVSTHSFGQKFGIAVVATNGAMNNKIKPNKRIAYVSPVYFGSETELNDKIESFINKYLPLVYSKYANQKNDWARESTSHSFVNRFDNKQRAKDRRNQIISDRKADGYEVIIINDDSESTAKPIRTETYFTNLKIDDDLYIDGTVVVKSKFVFFGYPHIVAEYQNLKITGIRYKGDAFSLNSNKANKFISLPYQPNSNPHIDADFWVWTPKIINPKPTRKEHYKIFNYPIKRLVSITDNFDNDEVDAYFNGFKHQEKSDSFFWEKSLLQNPKQSPMATYDLAPIKITSLKGAFVLNIKNKLDKYYHDKNYDFWGDKKKKSNTKKDKKDDFWNN